jgi:hypothetical protein
VTFSSQSGAGDVDAAWKFLDQNRDAAGASEAVDIDKMRRKIDWHIVPLMFCCYTMQFLDKVILNVSPTCPKMGVHADDIIVFCCDGSESRPQAAGKRLLQHRDISVRWPSLL